MMDMNHLQKYLSSKGDSPYSRLSDHAKEELRRVVMEGLRFPRVSKDDVEPFMKCLTDLGFTPTLMGFS